MSHGFVFVPESSRSFSVRSKDDASEKEEKHVLLLQPRIMPWFSSRKVPPARPGLDFSLSSFLFFDVISQEGRQEQWRK